MKLQLERYPKTNSRSLKPFNAADEYIINYIIENSISKSNAAILNDRFGFLTLSLFDKNPSIYIDYKSQEKAILNNLALNNYELTKLKTVNLLSGIDEKFNLGIIKIPKSLDLFEYYLNHLAANISDDGIAICGFMTKYFSPSILKIASSYFNSVEQSLAWKKSRLLILKKKIDSPPKVNITTLTYNGTNTKQYPGVFSSKKIDFATQFLLENFHLQKDEQNVLDLACGNGIIAQQILVKSPEINMHLVDDQLLSIESAKLNLSKFNAKFFLNDNLEFFDNNFFNLIISNPPFHFEYENNIEVALTLFNQAFKKLKSGGRMVIVANKHLNYITHLKRIFDSNKIISENENFVIYESKKNR